jgi:DNA-directed RNA polymerase subunit K/omega
MDLDIDTDNNDVDEFADDLDEIGDVDIKVATEDNKLITYIDVNNIIAKNSKKTIPILNKYEKARICGLRLQQLAEGAKPTIDPKGLKSIPEIVKKEYEMRMIPFIIERSLPNGEKEYWKMEEFDYLTKN